ncbi:fatty acid synthase-like [Bacillus rossius redtenbacheri]|uniref:fatty acid synthase-like n=1 Tax=Bacillus rossius redtenbacheri TaxID=93214 RepID=UPI002FDD48BE
MAAPGAEVVISGVSGRFPECDSVAEFRDKLFAGEHLVSCDRRRQDLGPSAALDTGCSSSLYALEAAVASIAGGRCDAAVVAATNVSLNPLLSTALLGAGALTRDGRCKVFDNSADGYTRAEAVVAVLLQRGADARRLYAEVLGTGTNCDGRTAHSIMFPSAEAQAALMTETCRRAGVDPLSMGYIEAHGTGTKVGDPQELRAIAEAYCGGRSSPLLVGSVKSNMGHAEAASGLCSLVKVVLAFETGLIPPNLHFAEPNRGVPQLLDGRIQVGLVHISP